MVDYCTLKYFSCPYDKICVSIRSTSTTSSLDSSEKLIKIQSRGGLTAATLGANQIFFKAEEIFRACTANGLQKIEINSMVEELLQDVELVSIFNGIIESSGNSNDIDVDVQNNIILTMLKLYLRVPTFSLSRDVIARHRQELKVKKANKGIRKTLKAYR